MRDDLRSALAVAAPGAVVAIGTARADEPKPHRLGPEDHLMLKGWDLRNGAPYRWVTPTGEFVVGAGGTVSLPLVGELDAQNLSSADLCVLDAGRNALLGRRARLATEVAGTPAVNVAMIRASDGATVPAHESGPGDVVRVTLPPSRGLDAALPSGDAFKQPMYLLADLALGSGYPVDELVSPAVMRIAHIRAYRDRSATP